MTLHDSWLSVWRKTEEQRRQLVILSWVQRLKEAGIDVRDVRRVEIKVAGRSERVLLVGHVPLPDVAAWVFVGPKAPPVRLGPWLHWSGGRGEDENDA